MEVEGEGQKRSWYQPNTQLVLLWLQLLTIEIELLLFIAFQSRKTQSYALFTLYIYIYFCLLTFMYIHVVSSTCSPISDIVSSLCALNWERDNYSMWLVCKQTKHTVHVVS